LLQFSLISPVPNKIGHIRSLAAAWFLGLFLFIYAEKLLHSHLGAQHINKMQAHLSAPSACALCEFQPGKDAELFTQPAVSAPILELPFQPVQLSAILHDLYFSTHGDRGPPFLA
jgi:hypothetical protein